jgi:site-specific recombinase XerD
MIVKEFSKWLQTTKGYSKSTIDNYCRTLEAFDRFILLTSN